MSLQLLVVSGPDKGQVFTLFPGSDMMMGRSAQASYRLNDGRVSRAHCQLLLDGEEIIVVCNGGSGGTLVNGKPIQRHTLQPGDVLQVGSPGTELEFAL